MDQSTLYLKRSRRNQLDPATIRDFDITFVVPFQPEQVLRLHPRTRGNESWPSMAG